MARKNGNGVDPVKSGSGDGADSSLPERRVATPNRNLMVIKMGEMAERPVAPAAVPTSEVIEKVAKVMAKPGADRTRVFQSSSGRPVYAYSIDADDPTKIVRVDVTGRRTVGRFSGGRFRGSRPGQAV